MSQGGSEGRLASSAFSQEADPGLEEARLLHLQSLLQQLPNKNKRSRVQEEQEEGEKGGGEKTVIDRNEGKEGQNKLLPTLL